MACDISKAAKDTYKLNYDIEPLDDLRAIAWTTSQERSAFTKYEADTNCERRSKYEADVVFAGSPC